MTAVMPLTILHVKAAEVAGGTAGVLASGYSGLEVAGTLGGIASSAVAVVALILSVAAGNTKRRRQYDADIAAARQAGKDDLKDELAELRADIAALRSDRDAWRNRYLDIIENRGRARHVIFRDPGDDEGRTGG